MTDVVCSPLFSAIKPWSSIAQGTFSYSVLDSHAIRHLNLPYFFCTKIVKEKLPCQDRHGNLTSVHLVLNQNFQNFGWFVHIWKIKQFLDFFRISFQDLAMFIPSIHVSKVLGFWLNTWKCHRILNYSEWTRNTFWNPVWSEKQQCIVKLFNHLKVNLDEQGVRSTKRTCHWKCARLQLLNTLAEVVLTLFLNEFCF